MPNDLQQGLLGPKRRKNMIMDSDEEEQQKETRVEIQSQEESQQSEPSIHDSNSQSKSQQSDVESEKQDISLEEPIEKDSSSDEKQNAKSPVESASENAQEQDSSESEASQPSDNDDDDEEVVEESEDDEEDEEEEEEEPVKPTRASIRPTTRQTRSSARRTAKESSDLDVKPTRYGTRSSTRDISASNGSRRPVPKKPIKYYDSDDKGSDESEASLQSDESSEAENEKLKQTKINFPRKKKVDPYAFESQDMSSSEKEQVKPSRKRKAKVVESEEEASSDDSAEVPENVFPSEEEEEDDSGLYDLEYEQEQRENYNFTKRAIQKIVAQRKTEEGTDEWLIKWNDISWLHCTWEPEKTINRFDGQKKLKSYLSKPMVVEGAVPSEGIYFNPKWTEVERIVDKRHRTLKGILKFDYLVKWSGLGYEDCTWEPSFFIMVCYGRKVELMGQDKSKIKEFNKKNTPPNLGPIIRKFKPLDKSPTYKNGLELRSYQLEGLNWLLYCWTQRTNCILADEMGLGKTIQSAALLHDLFNIRRVPGPFLIVVPLSVLSNWKREMDSWTNLNVLTFHGSEGAREVMKAHEFYFKGKNQNTRAMKFHALLTTYEMLGMEINALKQIRWRYAIIDEAHKLKNKDSRSFNMVKTLQFEHLLLLTGTPVQNNTTELWTLLNLVDEPKFPSLGDFLTEFGTLQDSEAVDKLQVILKPYMLRRLKEHVEKSIAPKEETIIEVELTKEQKKYYRALLERNFSALKGGKNIGKLVNIMMELRKLCNHPYLIKGVEDMSTGEFKSDEERQKHLIQCSGKLVLVDKLLPKLKEGGHKVLIFSQMTMMLDILEDYLNHRGYTYVRLDGSVEASKRQHLIDRFSAPESEMFVFLLSTRAGGIGINLTVADTCIIFDSDWNPQNDLQAQARCHRIGQTQLVKVYRLITKGTYESRMFQIASKKLGLDSVILTKITSGPEAAEGVDLSNPKGVDKKLIDSLLKYGAYDLFNTKDNEDDKFCEEDIDQILGRAIVIKQQEQDLSAVGLGTFSKATFTAADAEPELDLDDPLFWSKLMPIGDQKKKSKEEFSVPRGRRVTRGYRENQEQLMNNNNNNDNNKPEKEKEKEERKVWKQPEIAKVRKAVFSYGYGRWSRVKQALESRSMEELHAMAKCIVRAYWKAGQAEKKKEKTDQSKPEESDEEKKSDQEKEEVPEDEESFFEAITIKDPTEDTQEDIDYEPSDEDIAAIMSGDYQFIAGILNVLQAVKTMGAIAKVVVPCRLAAIATLNAHEGRSEDFMDLGEADERAITKALLKKIPVPGFVHMSKVREWNIVHDRALLLGYYKHGFAEFNEILQDNDLGLTDISIGSNNKITLRVKKLIGKYQDLNFKFEDMQVESDNEIKHKKKKQKKIKEVKEDHTDQQPPTKPAEWAAYAHRFIKYVKHYGVPIDKDNNQLWDEVRKQTDIPAEDKHFEEFYEEMLNFCKAKINDKDLDTNYPLYFTKDEAANVMSRLITMKQVYSLLNYPKLKTKLASFARNNMPPFWEPEHDYALLQGISKHGLGCWDTILNDNLANIHEKLKENELSKKKKKTDDNNIEITSEKHPKIQIFTLPKVKTRIERLYSHCKPDTKPTNDNAEGEEKDKHSQSKSEKKLKLSKTTDGSDRDKDVPLSPTPSTKKKQGILNFGTSSKDAMDTDSSSKKRKPESEASADIQPKSTETKKPKIEAPPKITAKPTDSMLPLVVDENLTIRAWGQIVNNPTFCQGRYIFPVGFKTYFKYLSRQTPGQYVQYKFSIEGDDKPKFKVSGNDSAPLGSDNPVQLCDVLMTAAGALKEQQTGKRQVSIATAEKAAELFGYGKVLDYLENLPGASDLKKAAAQKPSPGKEKSPKSKIPSLPLQTSPVPMKPIINNSNNNNNNNADKPKAILSNGHANGHSKQSIAVDLESDSVKQSPANSVHTALKKSSSKLTTSSSTVPSKPPSSPVKPKPVPGKVQTLDGFLKKSSESSQT